MKSVRQLFTGSEKPFPGSLSDKEKQLGRRLFYRFYTLNGISVACLMNNILVLYAIRNGLTDSMVAVMASFIHLAMPLMILGKPAIARLGAARTRGLGWFFRYVFAFIMIAAPFAGRFSQGAVTALLLSGAFGFAAFRSIGIAAVSPLHGEVAEAKERGRFISSALMRVQFTYFLTMALIILVFRFTDELWVYQVIIGIGCVIGFFASSILALIPESTAPRNSAKKPFLQMLNTSLKTPAYRRLFLAWCAGMASKAVVIPFMMIALKNGYGVSDYHALLYVLILVLGAAGSGLLNRKIADAAGARVLLPANIGGLMAAALFWSLAPKVFMPWAVGFFFFLTGFSETGIAIGLNQHFLAVVPGRDRVGNSLLMHIGSGAAAGLAGSVLGGGLLQILSETGFREIYVYRFYFLLILPFLLLFLITAGLLER